MVLSENGSLPPKFISIGNTVMNSRIFECVHVYYPDKTDASYETIPFLGGLTCFDSSLESNEFFHMMESNSS
jgi:hypothetical protein